MTRIPLLLLVLLPSVSYAGEWRYYGASADGMTTYYDPSTVRVVGKSLIVWTLYDYATPQKDREDTFQTEVTRIEVDCRGDRTRELAQAKYAGRMSEGNAVSSAVLHEEWLPVFPNSIDATLLDVVCKRRKHNAKVVAGHDQRTDAREFEVYDDDGPPPSKRKTKIKVKTKPKATQR